MITMTFIHERSRNTCHMTTLKRGTKEHVATIANDSKAAVSKVSCHQVPLMIQHHNTPACAKNITYCEETIKIQY